MKGFNLHLFSQATASYFGRQDRIELIGRRAPVPLTPKRISSGQELYSEGARGTLSGTRRARGKLISVFSCNMGMFPTLFPSLAPPRNAKVGRAGLMKAAKMGG